MGDTKLKVYQEMEENDRKSEWLIEKGSCYSSLGDNWIGSDIYVNIDGEMAKICSVHLVLTQKEHFQLRKIENEYENYLHPSAGKKKHWWQRDEPSKSDWKEIHKKYWSDRENTYKRPKVLHDKYLSIVLAAQSAVDLLARYKEVGTIDTEELERVLSIARGDIAPIFEYTGQICSCGHKDASHTTKYSWDKNGVACTEDKCNCKHFEHATDIVGVIKTVNLRELREEEKTNEQI